MLFLSNNDLVYFIYLLVREHVRVEAVVPFANFSDSGVSWKK